MRNRALALSITAAMLLAVSPGPADSLSSLLLEWTLPSVELLPQPDGTVWVVADGYLVNEEPGSPRLPYTSTLIAIPPGVTPSLHILSVETATIPLPGPISIVPQPERALVDEGGFPTEFAFISPEPSPVPSSPIVLEELGIMRGVRLARILFRPLLPVEGHLHVYRHIKAEVTWEKNSALAVPVSPKDPLLEAIRQAVLNPRDVSPVLPPTRVKTFQVQGAKPEVFIEISRPGLYQVTYENLKLYGFSGVNPANLRLFQGNNEVAYRWIGDEDETFEPGEYILFYAEPRFSRWTDVDVYRLIADSTPGMRMLTRSSVWIELPPGIPWIETTYEANLLYTPNCFCGNLPPGRDGDRWVWADLMRPNSPVFSTSFPLNVNPSFSATLKVWMIGYTSVAANPDHRIEVVLNGVHLGNAEWDGKTAITATFTIPPHVLAHTNSLQISLPGIPDVKVEGAWLDGFSLQFAGGADSWGSMVTFSTRTFSTSAPPSGWPHHLYLPLVMREAGAALPMRAYTVKLNPSRHYQAYDITDPLHPVQVLTLKIEGQQITLIDPGDRPRRYLVATEEAIRPPDRIRPREDLGNTNGADYLIITHPLFAEAISPLAELRRSQGLTVATVNVLGIYDSHGDGRPDPEAIRNFIADAYHNWNPRPTYILLVGDGSYDPRRHLPSSPPSFIPPYLTNVDPWAGETAADNRYVCVDGEDNLPDLLLGRLPVKNPDEARAVVRKILNYETNPLPGGWNAFVLLIADNPDEAGDFHTYSEASAKWVTAPFTVNRHYCPQSSCEKEAPALHEVIVRDWNRGSFLIQYFGHSSWQQWAVERLFHLDNIPALCNSRRYPVLVEMTCFTGAFHRPEPTLDEELILRPEAGAVAIWGPTGLSLGKGHAYLSEGFFRAVFSHNVTTVGEATLAGKLSLAASNLYPELMDTYTLFGDPAQRWNRAIIPWHTNIYLPLVLRNFR